MSGTTKEFGAASLRRVKRYPAYRDSGVEWLGEIPAHWHVTKMWDVTRATSGATPPKETLRFWDGGIPWVSPKDMKRRFLDSSEDTVSAVALSEAGLKLVPNPSVLVVVRGMILAHSFPVGVTKVPVTINQDMKALRLRDDVHPEFFAYWLEGVGRDLLAVLVEEAAHGTKAIRMDRWRVTPVEIPPEDEQRAIVAFLDRETTRIDALVEKKERLIDLLQEKRTALITWTVTGLAPKVKLMVTESAVFPEIPERWKLQKLRRLIRRVKRPVVVEPEAEYREIGIRSWGRGIFHKDPLRGELLEDKSVFDVEPNDLVLNIVFAWEGAVGVVSDRELGMIASHRFPTFRHAEEVDLDYLLMVLQSEQGRALMGINSPGAAGRNRTIRLDQFLEEEVPLPSLAEQRGIVGAFRTDERRLEALLAKIREAIDRLKELRTGLISAAVTGKIDVRNEAAA